MKTIDYINNLIKEKDDLKELCKEHVETIRTMKKEIIKKDKIIKKLENSKGDAKIQKEFNNIKGELESLKVYYEDLHQMYESAVEENEELKNILNNIESSLDSD